jgi:DNA processing protein
MREDELSALIELLALPGIGQAGVRRLLARHGTARAALEAPAAELGLRAAALPDAERIRVRGRNGASWLRAAGGCVLRAGQAGWPEGMDRLDGGPCVLFARGDVSLLERPAVAVIGSRCNTEYGADAARLIAGGLAERGVVVVSGLARGIDGIAHAAALDAGGTTIAVLGSGIDVVYPPEHAALQERVAREGLVLTEQPPGEPALAHHFPRRNRIIAVLSRGVVVVEAGVRSGALSTVDAALAAGVEVFAVPGPIGRPTSVGTNALLGDGAALATGAEEVAAALGIAEREFERPAREELDEAVSGIAAAIVGKLGPDARHVDEIAALAGLAVSRVLAVLFELELAGRVRQLPGLRFALALEAGRRGNTRRGPRGRMHA